MQPDQPDPSSSHIEVDGATVTLWQERFDSWLCDRADQPHSTALVQNVSVIDTCASTQDACAEVSNMQPGWCCVAVQQTTGRGRLGRSWSDPSAGCATFTISQSFDRKHPERLSLQIGVAIANAVDATLRSVTTHSDSSESQPAVQIRWPNDVMVGNRKLAGVLIEVHHDIAWIGIGINVLHQKWPVELENIAISLAELPAVGSTHSLEQPDIIIAILESLEAVQSYNDEQLIAAFGRRNYLQDRICTFEHAGVRHTGRIHSFNPLVGLELDVSKGGINRNVNAETSPAPQIVHLPAQTTSLVHDK